MTYFVSAVLFPLSDMHEFMISGFLFCHNQSDVFLVNFFYNVVAAQMCCCVSAACMAWCVCRVFYHDILFLQYIKTVAHMVHMILFCNFVIGWLHRAGCSYRRRPVYYGSAGGRVCRMPVDAKKDGILMEKQTIVI